MYDTLLNHYGPQHWWPADSFVEMIVGAVLTQNTNWKNVERALDNLKIQNLLSLKALQDLPIEELAELIRPAGYYNIKARRLKNLVALFVETYEGEPELFFQEDLEGAREQLLSVKGIGPETADSILLYGCEKPVFVIDAYTCRIFSRHGLLPEESDYAGVQEIFHDALPQDVALYNEYHALIVQLAKDFCKKKNPSCEECPLCEDPHEIWPEV